MVLTLTLVAVGIYTWKTWDMASATRQSAEAAQRTLDEMRESRDEESRPYVLCGFELEQGNLVYFYVRNTGKSVAADVKLVIDPPLTASIDTLGEMTFLTDGIASLAPGQEIRTFFDSLIGLYGDNANVPLRYSATTTYFGGMEPGQRRSEQTLDVNVYRGTFYTTRKDFDDLVSEVKTVARSLDHIQGSLKDVSNTLEGGLWIRNPDLIVTTRRFADTGTADALAAKLQEFKLVWEAAPRETSGRAKDLIYQTASDVQAHARQVGQQLLAVLSALQSVASDEVLSDGAAISAQLLQLSRKRLYTEIEEFNELGNQVVGAVEDLLQRLPMTHPKIGHVPTDSEQSDATPTDEVRPHSADNTNESEPTTGAESRRRKPRSRRE